MLDRLRNLPRQIVGQLRLLRDNPEQLGRNLSQFTNPGRFEAGLVDVLSQPPLHVSPQAGAAVPALNVLQPFLNQQSMTGGPNTILLVAALVAEQGIPVRIVTSHAGHRPDADWLDAHLTSLLGRRPPEHLRFASAAEPDAPLAVGADDLWFATHWTTAQALKMVLPRMRRNWFMYFVQDFEPGFYAWSSNYALALETYGMRFRALVNEHFLATHLVAQAAGRFADPGFLERQCMAFEPAVDRRVFHPPTDGETRRRPKRLLFYTRPTNPRNMLGVGIDALRQVVASGAFAGEWEFLSIGARGSMPPLALGAGRMLVPAPWASYAGYADSLREADIMLCPMLSPHTSYPVLEMAACGGLALTNTYGPKTAEALSAMSPDIRGVAPTVEAFADGLRETADEVEAGRPRSDRLVLPHTWDAVLPQVAAWVAGAVRDIDA